jgi:hypothetical protein
MSNSKITLVVVFACLIAVPAVAQTTASVGTFSTYMVDNGTQVYEKPILYGSIRQDLPAGFSVGLWGSVGKDGGRELDYLAAWGNKYFSLEVGYFQHAGGSPANLVQVDLRGGYPIKKVGSHTLEPYVMMSRIMPTNTDGDSGTLIRAGLSHSWDCWQETKLLQSAWLMYDTGVFKGEQGFVFRYEVGIARQHFGVTIQPLVRLSVPVNVNDRKTRVVAGLRLNI